MKPKLIIIRGPSGSGKSTVANELFKRTKRPTLLVSEDTIRKMFSDHTKAGHLPGRHLALKAVSTGLKDGYDVIYHGILRVNDGEELLDELLGIHPGSTYFFYLDVGLEETLKRHLSRPKQHEFSVEAMKKWWNFSSPTGSASETIITEQSSLEDTIAVIRKVTGI